MFVSDVRALRSSRGRLRVAEVARSSATDGREDEDWTSKGEAMVQRRFVSVCSCVEMAMAIMSMFSRKVITSPERISRSDGSGIWPESSAETRSMHACRSSGKVGAREGRVVSVLMSTRVLKNVERAAVRFWDVVSNLLAILLDDRECINHRTEVGHHKAKLRPNKPSDPTQRYDIHCCCHPVLLMRQIMDSLTRRISSCMRCFFVSRVEPSGFNFRVHRSLYSVSKFGLRCNVVGSTGGNMFVRVCLQVTAVGRRSWCNV